ncbi:MAG: Uma2 family endonuclease [Actinomycetes bacterium]
MAVPSLARSGRPMTWNEYQQLGEDARAEYIDGHVVVTPGPTRQHQDLLHRLVNALQAVLPPGLRVISQWNWKPAADEFIPDVMVYPVTEESIRFTGMPVLVVEALSTNRADDLVRKATKYAAAGLQNYWVVDVRDGVLDAFRLTDGVYSPVAHVERGDVADVVFGPGTLRVDLDVLLAD